MNVGVVSGFSGEGVVVVGLFEGGPVPGFLKDIYGAEELIQRKLDSKEFTGDLRQLQVVTCRSRTIALVGLGKKKDCTLDHLRRVAGHAVRNLRDFSGFTSFIMALHLADVPNISLEQRAQAVAEGSLLGSYQFLKYKTVGVDKVKSVKGISFVGDDISAAVGRARVLAECTILARDIVNEPPSVFTPVKIAESARHLEELGVKVTILGKKQIEAKGMHALLAVSGGSVIEPRFVVMEYDGGGSRIAVAGKGITFDSGGLNIKSEDGMATMKCDMAGAAVVLGVVKACAMLKLHVHLFGIMVLTENMPGENAYKPGDIIGSYNGKSIEVLSTDAEGRIVLADALTYAERDVKADAIIDVATLTGAVVACFGHVCAGVLGDDDVVAMLQKSGEATGDRLWRLPLWQEYQDMIKSDVADVANLGKYKRSSGTITAAAFLKAFVEKTPWAHIDIAGTAWSDEDVDYLSKGGTGWGVRLLVHALENWS